MKKIEDIEKLNLEELENISSDRNIKIPKYLRTKIAARIIATKYRTGLGFAYAGLAAILVIAILTAIPQNPEDTFDDPVQARAELERTFTYISAKISKGLDIVEETATTVKKPTQIINEMNN